MQLVCNGVRLDLYEGTGLQFKKTNPAFAFDAMSAERTTNFKLPATPTNDRVFECAKLPAYKGAGMRKKFDATLIDGVVVMEGFLYVASFDGKDYNAIFVGGLAYDLKKWTNADWGRLNLTPAYVPDTVYDANDVGSAPIVARVKYHNLDGIRRPSINLSQLFAALNAQNVFRISGTTDSNLRLIRPERHDIEGAVVSLINGANARDYDLDLSTSSDLVTVEQAMLVGVDGQGYDIYAKCFVTPNVCRITFPDDTPPNLCLCYSDWSILGVAFLGSRKFVYDNGQVVYTGAPLAGQTIEITGTQHIQLDRQKFVLMTAEGATWNGSYFNFNNFMEYVPQYDVAVKITSDYYAAASDIKVPTLSMLQGLSLGELLKLYAACTGLLINVKANGSVEFMSDFSGADIELVGMEQSEVKRTFADYAQSNVLQFKESEDVEANERLFAYYTVPNDNIEESKDLLTLNVSEGGIYQGFLVVRGDEDTIGVTRTDEWMKRASLKKSTLLQTLCSASTQVKMKARMDMRAFSLIDSASTFNYKNTRYSWTDAVWSSNVAQFTLAKIA